MPFPTMRVQAQVWPVWIPRVLAQVEQRSIGSAALPAVCKQPLPPLLFSASFQSLLPTTHDSLSAKWTQTSKQLQRNRPYVQIRTGSVQCRAYSTSRRFSTSPTSPPPLQAEHTDCSKQADWTLPVDVENRPVAIIGAGVLGRRLAVIWASTGRSVNVYDSDPTVFETATPYIADTISTYCAENGTHPGKIHLCSSILEAISSSWLIIEAVPEDLELKISLLGRLDRLAPLDAIISTATASYTSRELVPEVRNRHRVLNTLYYIPPSNRCVELMSCGYTSTPLIDFLSTQMKTINLLPMIVKHESHGLIFPRLFAAMKRETLQILKDDVAQPEEIDELFKDFFGADKGVCEKMDEVGLDTIALMERRFLDEREKRNETELWRGRGHLEWLEREFVQKGKLGVKSGEGLIVRKGEEEVVKKDAEEVWNEHALDLSGM